MDSDGDANEDGFGAEAIVVEEVFEAILAVGDAGDGAAEDSLCVVLCCGGVLGDTFAGCIAW